MATVGTRNFTVRTSVVLLDFVVFNGVWKSWLKTKRFELFPRHFNVFNHFGEHTGVFETFDAIHSFLEIFTEFGEVLETFVVKLTF